MNKITIDITEPSENNIFAEVVLTHNKQINNPVTLDNCFFEDIYRYTNETSSTAFEFYLLSVIIYNIDKLLSRKTYSIDGWTREICFDYPVTNPEKWAKIKNDFCVMLNYLTGDIWDVNFKKTKIINYFSSDELKIDYAFKPDKVCLFSGGLDSLIGSYELLKNNNKALLVSHYDPGLSSPKNDQQKLIDTYSEKYTRYENFDWVFNRVGISTKSRKLETTFRSRSIIFIGIATYLANNLTPGKSFYIPENGTISLNIPLTPSRRSSCSTKTTHPFVLSSLNKIFSKLNIRTSVENPYEFLTKGEMLELCLGDSFFHNLAIKSNSCGKRGHKIWWYNKGKNKDGISPSHCGKCMPCIYRRAAMNKIGIDNEIFYGDNIFQKSHWNWRFTNKSKRMKDVRSLLYFLAKNYSKEKIQRELLINGSLPLNLLDKYSDVVIRTIKEIKEWIESNSNYDNYSNIKTLAKIDD